ncbi:MAG: type II secretion system F family protein [Acidobacteria bacterium]|nr:type II secretion system F family protein [Acidobacteriota bacterium]
MFLFVSFLIFSGALFGAAWYVYSVPRQEESRLLGARLREIRAKTAGGRGPRAVSDLMIHEDRGRLTFLTDFMQWLGPARRMQAYIVQANLQYKAGDVLTLCLLIGGAAYLLLGLAGMSLTALRIVFSLALSSLPIMYIRRVRNRRLARFEENLPDAIDLFNRSMKAGHNIHAGLETIATETLDPVKMEFKKVVEELALGSQLEAALHLLGARVPLIDLKFFITGLILQRQTGANMVAVLENLSVLIRERLNLAAKMKAATTQQRFSAGLLCVLPVVVGLGFWVVKPEYIRLLYSDETGSKFLTYAICSELVGILIIRRISSPRL